MASEVYLTRDISPEKVVEMYRATGRELDGRVAVKIHSGEQGNITFWRASARPSTSFLCTRRTQEPCVSDQDVGHDHHGDHGLD